MGNLGIWGNVWYLPNRVSFPQIFFIIFYKDKIFSDSMDRGLIMRHVISFSGGKDSTAMLLRMIEMGMDIDEVRYFDCGTWEFPQIHDHIEKVEKYINMPVTRMRHRYSFDYLFAKKKTNKGFIGYGFPSMIYRWCTGKKMDTLRKGIFKEDVLSLESENLPPNSEALLLPVMKEGKLITNLPTLDDIKTFYLSNIKKLPSFYKKLEDVDPFELKISNKLLKLTDSLKYRYY